MYSRVDIGLKMMKCKDIDDARNYADNFLWERMHGDWTAPRDPEDKGDDDYEKYRSEQEGLK